MLTQLYQRRQGKGRLSQCFQFVLQYHIIISCSPGSILALVHSWEYTPWHTRTQSWTQRISAINTYNSITPETLLCRISRYTKHRVFVWCRKRGSLKPLQMWASSPSTQLRLCLFAMWDTLALTVCICNMATREWMFHAVHKNISDLLLVTIISVILASYERASSVQNLQL